MATALPIRISPAVLTWARQSVGYSVEEAAHKLQVKDAQIAAWEAGTANPTYTQLENMAYKVYKRPLAVFFRNEPPQEVPIGQDFRNLNSAEISHLSTAIRLALRKAKRLQNLLRGLGADEEALPRYRQFTVSVRDNPAQAAERFRLFLGLSIEEQKSWKADEAFDRFKALVEGIGIYVFQFTMPFEEARAFSLTEPVPVIVLNTEDAKNGRIFSLFHEVCHILFNLGGVFKDRDTARLTREYRAVEDFCNRFASAFLLPVEVFQEDLSGYERRVQEWGEEDLERLARMYSVSKEAVLRKLVDLRLASKDFYFSKKRSWDASLRTRKELINQKAKERAKEKGTSGGIPQDIKTVMERGKPYISKVLDGYRTGRLTYNDLSDYLGVKLDYVPKIIDRITR